MNNEKDFLSLGWRLANIEVESSDAIDMKWNKWPEVDPIHYNWHRPTQKNGKSELSQNARLLSYGSMDE